MDAMHAWNDYEQTGVYNCDIPALTVVDNNVETRSSTFFIEDGSYVKLKTLTLGYTFPDKWIKKHVFPICVCICKHRTFSP